jgi:hypothetical protein
LGEVFVRVDRELKGGVSRQLVLDVFTKMGFFISEDESTAFLA